MIDKLTRFLISFFYIGYIKYAPGSISSLLILIIWFFIPNDVFLQLKIIIIIMIFGFSLIYLHTKNISKKDPQYIVIDEIVGMLISLYLIPKVVYLYFFAFILFRFFDIFKPSIIFRSQNLKYGVGIMVDDILAGILTYFIVRNIY